MSLREEILDFFKNDRRAADFGWLSELPSWKAGNMVLCNRDYPNIIYWFDMSEETVATLQEMLNAKELHFTPASQLSYLVAGKVPKVPIVKQKRAYKKPHWLPVGLAPGPT